MPHWLVDIENERLRARESSHPARVRTSARRIAGIALSEYRRITAGASTEESFITLLAVCAADTAMPDAVRDAARRLGARVSADFSSPSTDPMGDADAIVGFVASLAQKS